MGKGFFVHESSMVTNVAGADSSKIYRECKVVNSILGERTTIGDYSQIGDCKFAENVTIQRNAMIYSTEVGRYSYTGKNFVAWHADIGAFCSLSWNVSIGGANHDYRRATTHSFLYAPEYGIFENEAGYNRFTDKCSIGNDVWIAANACICRGVSIGNGAVVAAGTVVTHDVEPYTIVAGVPAKPIKKLFSNEIIQLLNESEWWKLPVDIIKENFHLFNQVQTIESAEEIYNLQMKYKERKKC